MITPGRIYCGSTLRIPVNYTDGEGVDVDPTTVTFKLYSPEFSTTTYVYGSDVEVIRPTTGNYYIDVSPTVAGRWAYRWASTGTNKASAVEGTFVVQTSVFYNDATSDAYR